MRTSSSLCGLFLIVSPLVAQGGVAPPALAEAFGGSRFVLPWERLTSRTQYLYEASALPPSLVQAKVISALGWRRLAYNSPTATGTVDTELALYSSALTAASFGTTFSANRTGLGGTVFARKVIALPAPPTATSPVTTWFTIALDTPQLFLGPGLVVEIINYGGSTNLGWYADNCGGAGTGNANWGTKCGASASSAYGQFVTPTPPWMLVYLSQGLPSAPAACFVGVSSSTWGFLPLPLDLTVFNMAGCNLYTSLDLSFPMALDSTGFGQLSINLPALTAPLTLHAQWAILDVAANGLGVAMSNATTFGVSNMTPAISYRTRPFDTADTAAAVSANNSGPVLKLSY